jgi:uncharacterized membrane protein
VKRLTNYFLQGLLFLVPLVVTVYVFYIVFQKIDGLLRKVGKGNLNGCPAA